MLNRLKRWIAGRGRGAVHGSALARLREALDVLPEGLAFYDADDRIVIWNARYAELNEEAGTLLVKGADFRDLLKAGLRTGVYPQAAGREAEWLEERLALRRSNQCALEQENKGHWLRIVERRTADGGIVSICEDITDLKRREATQRLMFENNPVPMWVLEHPSLRFLAVNEAAITDYGFTGEQFLQMNALQLMPPEDADAVKASMAAGGGGGSYRGDRSWRQFRADGSEMDILPFAQKLTYEDRPALIVALFDVTVRKRAEKAMAQARDEAQAANRAKSEFLANMSHEIRTPLNGVTGVAQVLSNTPLSTAQQEMVGIIESSALTLERLLSDLLDLARVEAGRVEIENLPFDLGEAVRATAALSNMRALEKGVELVVQIAPEAEGVVAGDEGRVKQILTNLLSNAVKFTPAGRVTLSVAARGTADAAVFAFSVEDTGVGFDPAKKERLFSRFEQEDGSVTRKFGGTGLGLAISRNLAELMGGRMDARSELGRGSTFTLELPMTRVERAAPEPVAAPAGHAPSEPRRLRILLAEDHPTNRKVVELMLHGFEADMSCVENGEEAVAAVQREHFDVVLMDMQMPVLDGLSAIRRIREHERLTGAARLTIYTLSANAMTEHVAASTAAGADLHLTKPITAAVLLGALSELSQELAAQEAA